VIVFGRLAAMVREAGAAALVRVHAVRGSAPREEGACMIVRPDGAFHGTIGGGRLEWDALRAARDALREGRGPARFLDFALGPDLGQCCGGRVVISVETFDESDFSALDDLAAREKAGGLALRCRLDENGRVERLSDVVQARISKASIEC
jgi:xanthine dehydrogenase accessory factor